MINVRQAFRTLFYYLNHPVGRINRFATFRRMIRWQVGCRVLGLSVAVPWVDGTRLLVRKSMHGATGNVYVGLVEFEDMAFAQHLLGEGDAFIDVGANVGVYSILAASRDASVLALEPVPQTYQQLLDNIQLNRYVGKISARNMGVGSRVGELKFSSELDSTNHVLTEEEAGVEWVLVKVDTLDVMAKGWRPSMIKIDVEGFEMEVIMGATELLSQVSLQAVLIELNGLGMRYGFSDDDIHMRLLDFGFSPVIYDPFSRQLIPLDHHKTSGNTLYVRRSAELDQRLQESRPIVWGDVRI